MIVDILTLFPEMFEVPLNTSMMKKAQDNDLVEINIHNLRDWAEDTHKTVDDRPYGGGPGMVLKVDIVDRALSDLKGKDDHVILLSPQGKVFSQKKALELSKREHIILIAGHYEGFDERIREHLVDEEVSIGEYVLTGGEIPAMAVVDAVVRLVPGVLDEKATDSESFSDGVTLDYPNYTRPEEYKGWEVPEILKSGNHAEIEKWRAAKAKEKTKNKD